MTSCRRDCLAYCSLKGTRASLSRFDECSKIQERLHFQFTLQKSHQKAADKYLWFQVLQIFFMFPSFSCVHLVNQSYDAFNICCFFQRAHISNTFWVLQVMRLNVIQIFLEFYHEPSRWSWRCVYLCWSLDHWRHWVFSLVFT